MISLCRRAFSPGVRREPVVLIEIIEDALEGFVRNLDVLAVAFGFLKLMHVEQAAIEIRDVAEEFFEVGRAVLAAFAEAFVEQPEQEVTVERVELVSCPFPAGSGRSRLRR